MKEGVKKMLVDSSSFLLKLLNLWLVNLPVELEHPLLDWVACFALQSLLLPYSVAKPSMPYFVFVMLFERKGLFSFQQLLVLLQNVIWM